MATDLAFDIQIKSYDELTKQEFEEILQIYQLFKPGFSAEWLRKKHLEQTHPTLYLVKSEGKIIAFTGFRWYRVATPFRKRAIPALWVCFSYRHPDAPREVRSLVLRSYAYALRSQLGRFWFLKPSVTVITTFNPRLYSRGLKTYAQAFPQLKTPVPTPISQFGRYFYNEVLGYSEAKVDAQLVVEGKVAEQYPIGPLWEASFAARDESYNDFFLDQHIHALENGERCITHRQLMFIGFNSFWGLVRRRFF